MYLFSDFKLHTIGNKNEANLVLYKDIILFKFITKKTKNLVFGLFKIKVAIDEKKKRKKEEK
jgi:hypothetical protein